MNANRRYGYGRKLESEVQNVHWQCRGNTAREFQPRLPVARRSPSVASDSLATTFSVFTAALLVVCTLCLTGYVIRIDSGSGLINRKRRYFASQYGETMKSGI